MKIKIKLGLFINLLSTNQIRIILLLTICLFGFSPTIRAQSTYTINTSKSNNIKLSGTSSLHDWDMTAHVFSGKANFDFKKGDNQTLIGLNSLTLSLPVTNLKSSKKALDKNAYKALQSDTHKNIVYKLLTAKVSHVKDQNFLIKTTGHLTIAGITCEEAMDVYCLVNKDASISCSGTKTLKMSDYKVKPPSFMLGAMKTGNALKVDFNVVFTKN